MMELKSQNLGRNWKTLRKMSLQYQTEKFNYETDIKKGQGRDSNPGQRIHSPIGCPATLP